MVLDVEVLFGYHSSIGRREIDPAIVLQGQLRLETVTIKMDVLLVAGHVVEAAGDFLVVLFDLLRIELKDDDCELIALDETTVRIDSEGLGHDWSKPEVSWSVGLVVELNR